MVRQTKVSFLNHKRLTLRGVVHEPSKFSSVLIYCHGFPGSMEGSSAKRMCQHLARLGIACLRFSFAGSPPSEGVFEKKLMSEEVKDIKAAITFTQKQYPQTPIILLGHSTGAIDAALYAYKEKRIAGLVIDGGLAYLDQAAHYDFTDRQVRDFWRKGHIVYKTKKYWTNNKKLHKAFYDEFFTLNIPNAIKRYKKPLLVLHGGADEAVPVWQARALYKLANKPKKLVIVPGADHRFKKNLPIAASAIAKFCHSVASSVARTSQATKQRRTQRLRRVKRQR